MEAAAEAEVARFLAVFLHPEAILLKLLQLRVPGCPAGSITIGTRRVRGNMMEPALPKFQCHAGVARLTMEK